MKKLSALLATIAVTTACFSSSQKAAVSQAALTCSKDELATIISGTGESLGLYVLETIVGGSPDWETALVSLATTYGPGLVNCAVLIADAYLTSATSTGSATTAVTADGVDLSAAKARAEQYLSDHPQVK